MADLLTGPEIAATAMNLGSSHFEALEAIQSLEPERMIVLPVFDASVYGDGELGGSTRLIVVRNIGEGYRAVMQREEYHRGPLSWRLNENGWVEELSDLSAEEVVLYLRFMEISARSLAAGMLADHGLRKEAA